MTLTYFDRGKIEGEHKALQRMAVKLLEARFGSLPPNLKQQVETMATERLEELLLAFARAQSLKDMGLEE